MAKDAGNKRAQIAVTLFVKNIVRYIGQYYAEMKGLDGIVFTAGIGENSDVIRKLVCDGFLLEISFCSWSLITSISREIINSSSVGTNKAAILESGLVIKPSFEASDVKVKPIGHWGTIAGQNFIYAHLNRVINKYDLDMFYIEGPGQMGYLLSKVALQKHS